MTDELSWTALLNLPPDARIEAVGESPPPPSEVGRGHSLEPIRLESLVPSFTRMRLETTTAAELGLDIQRWDLNPGIVRVTSLDEGAALVVRMGRVHPHDPGDVVFDTRTDAALVLHETPAGAIAVHIKGGHIQLARIREPVDSALGMFAGAPAAAPIALPALPALAELLEGAGSPDWLGNEYVARAESPSLLGRFEALGLVARLWEITSPRDREIVTVWMRAGRGTAASRVGDWLSAHDGAALASDVGTRAVASALSLLDRVTYVSELAETLSDAEMANVITGIRLDRDDLESAVVAMYLARANTASLREALAAIDERAHVRMTAIAHLGARAGRQARLVAAAREAPDAWWARVAP
jgi:hypothetical protein